MRKEVLPASATGRTFHTVFWSRALTVTEDDLTELLGGPPQYLIPFLWGMIPEGGGIRDLPRAVQIRSRDDQEPAPARPELDRALYTPRQSSVNG